MAMAETPAEFDLPTGPQADLTRALLQLHADAGRPGAGAVNSAIQRRVDRDELSTPVSRETVRLMLHGKPVSWMITESVALTLARLARHNEQEALRRFRRLWRAANPHHRNLPALDDGAECVLDIGAIESPNVAIPEAEIRFSLTNRTSEAIKVMSLELRPIRRDALQRTIAETVAGPIDEYYLSANLDDRLLPVELLKLHHLIEPNGTDGFFLKVTAPDGFTYEMELRATWKPLGSGERNETSRRFNACFPAQSIAGLLRAARASSRQGGADAAGAGDSRQ
ncbi:hypothetical protein ACIOBK_01740 [Micromonospora chokoriensis]